MNLLSLCQAAFPRSILPGTLVYNLLDSAAALMLALRDDPFVAVEQEESAAETLTRDIRFYRALFSHNQKGKTLFLPDPGGAEEAGRRAKILSLLGDDDSIVTSERNLVSAIWDSDRLFSGLPLLGRGVHMDRAALEDALAGLGYRKVPMVAAPGDYSVRGWIFDLFSPAEANPVRVEFFGDEIERLDFFDIETQLSVSAAESVIAYPAREGDAERDLLACTGGRDVFSFVRPDEKDRFSERAVFLSRFSFAAENAAEQEDAAGQTIEAGLSTLRGMGICRDERTGFEEIPSAISAVSRDHRVILVASSEGQAERIRDIFHEQDMVIARMDTADAAQGAVPVALVVATLSAGLFLPGLLILTERELFGERPKHRPIRKSRVANLLAGLDDIEPGDYVVHRDHGIGKFSGTVRRPSGDAEVELMQIEYEDGRVYLPIQNIGVLGKYRAEEGIIPRLDRVGGKTWQRKKERARKKVNELADRLLALYADRSQDRGFRFNADTALHHEFEDFFPYDETEDQIAAIAAIKEDMESDRPMDRLLCGDVGYGKTEVAMRAAFKAVYDGRQVAVLVPTTILAEQHFRTFTERFSGFPVMIDFLSRFKTGKESAAVLRRVAAGETDIVIGTHALLSRRVSFGRLGLLIVDEEHRFGVAQKERFKELSRGVDVLTLTATPIPRSLHMGLSGIRGISVIETPPEERLAVRTVVTPYRDDVVQEAIIYEMMRQGQVFFVHNRIGDIRRVAENIARLVPEARLAVAHGQMAARELEGIMRRFFSGELDVLVSTAIVGAGLDVPQANTIIIDGAERMGLADLYQLRGRVGRSSRKGHAYFIIPPETSMTDQAKRRIQAIREMSYLGAGFRLAMRDLEIRGAGNVFGPEQSGHIHEIGFDLYIEMLEQAVAERKGEPIREEREPAIELAMSAFIPEEYIGDPTLRMSLYRRISSVRDEIAIAGLQDELRDRFGTVPDEVMSLLEIVGLKILARGLSVERIREKGGEVSVLFSPDTPVQPRQLFGLAEGRKGNVKFLPNGFSLNVRNIQRDRITGELRSMLRQLLEVIEQ